MRGSVTNSYIVNLAVSDFCFLIGLPFLIITAVRRQWIFGYVCCKLPFLIITAVRRQWIFGYVCCKLSFLIITAVRRQWIFGYVCCKLFYISTSLNWFTSVRQ